MAIDKKAQLGLLDVLMENEEIEKMLNERQAAKEKLQPLREKYDTAHKKATAAIKDLELNAGTYRCGKFLVTVVDRDSREVSFELKSRRSIGIKPYKER